MVEKIRNPKDVYFSRRDFLKSAGLLAGSMVLAACGPAVEEATSTGTLPVSTETPVATATKVATRTPEASPTPDEIQLLKEYYKELIENSRSSYVHVAEATSGGEISKEAAEFVSVLSEKGIVSAPEAMSGMSREDALSQGGPAVFTGVNNFGTAYVGFLGDQSYGNGYFFNITDAKGEYLFASLEGAIELINKSLQSPASKQKIAQFLTNGDSKSTIIDQSGKINSESLEIVAGDDHIAEIRIKETGRAIMAINTNSLTWDYVDVHGVITANPTPTAIPSPTPVNNPTARTVSFMEVKPQIIEAMVEEARATNEVPGGLTREQKVAFTQALNHYGEPHPLTIVDEKNPSKVWVLVEDPANIAGYEGQFVKHKEALGWYQVDAKLLEDNEDLAWALTPDNWVAIDEGTEGVSYFDTDTQTWQSISPLASEANIISSMAALEKAVTNGTFVKPIGEGEQMLRQLLVDGKVRKTSKKEDIYLLPIILIGQNEPFDMMINPYALSFSCSVPAIEAIVLLKDKKNTTIGRKINFQESNVDVFLGGSSSVGSIIMHNTEKIMKAGKSKLIEKGGFYYLSVVKNTGSRTVTPAKNIENANESFISLKEPNISSTEYASIPWQLDSHLFRIDK